MLKKLLALLLMATISCTTFSGLRNLDELDEGAFERTKLRVVTLVVAVADAAIIEDHISLDGVHKLGNALKGIALGTSAGAVGTVVDGLDLGGYSSVALAIITTEIDARLEARGAYDADGLLSGRGKEILLAVADGLLAAVADE